MDFKALAKDADSKKDCKKSPMCTLPGGLFCVMGENTMEHDEIKYKGQLGFKYGKTKADWLRISYTDVAALYAFIGKEKAFVNEMLKEEQEAMSDLILK
jgi:hypothetical protein